MTLDRTDFAAFFAALHDGHGPFAWQERLLDTVLEKGQWPGRIGAPTGSGKTAVIDVHVFAQALAVDNEGPAPPRRLALVVNRRVLVDDQYRHARFVARQLATGSDPVVRAVGERLWQLRTDDRDDQDSPLVLGRLRGGEPPSRSWRDHPTAAGVICATPDMWGSRLLFRGYGSSTKAWPREAGLLAFDSVVVVDEAHLSDQLLCSARRVAELAPAAERPLPVPPLQVVETTATPSDSATADVVQVDADDLDNPHLAARLQRPKPVTLRPVKDWASCKSPAPVAALADAVHDLLPAGAGEPQHGAARTVGCFVNTVGRAVAVASALGDRSVGGRRLRVVMVCGQARPVDVEYLEVACPGLLSIRGNDAVDVLVSTQSLEVGVDLDLAGMVTELASGSALAQRAGRVNRRGLRPAGPIVVTLPDDEIGERTQSGPYSAEELHHATSWLQGRSADTDGLSPWALQDSPAPRASARRMLMQRPELGQAWYWARTSDDLAAEPDLALWLSEDFDSDTAVGLVVRRELPKDSGEAVTLVGTLRPRRHEIFAVPFATARAAVDAVPEDMPVVVVRGEEVFALKCPEADEAGSPRLPRIRPGDQVVIDSSAALFTQSDSQFSPPVVVPGDTDGSAAERFPAPDVLEGEAQLPERWAERRVGGVVHRIEPSDTGGDELVAALSEDVAEQERAAVREWLTERPDPSAMQRAAAELLELPPRQADVEVQRDDEGRPLRALIVDRRRAVADEAVRQVWTPRGHEVMLADHQEAVAERAGLVGVHLGLPNELVDALGRAGRHHDDGKQDERFQRRLGADPSRLLAKSPGGTTVAQARRNAKESGLPPRWRHEQRSVVDCWDSLAGCADPQLVARLVGTSHGHGRNGFPHTAGGLLVELDAEAEDLFDLGLWDELIEHTQYRYGVWGCAYLEALLRCADGQISGEGR